MVLAVGTEIGEPMHYGVGRHWARGETGRKWIYVERDPLAAIERVVKETPPSEVVLATGSVYLIGEIYPYFLARTGRRGLFPEAPA